MKVLIAIFALLVICQFFYVAHATESKTFVAEENDQKCDMCKYVVGEVEQYMNSSEAQIEKALVEACKKLPGGLEQMCDTIVVLYGHQIIQYIVEAETPPVLCHQIGLCPAPKEVKVEVKEENDAKCDLCQYVVGLLEDYVKGNNTEAKIKEALEKVCSKLGPIQGMCKAFVDTYEPQLIDLLLKKLPPKEACKKLHLCPQDAKKPAPKPAVVPKSPQNEDVCPMCKFVVSTVEQYLKDNATVEMIEEKIKKWCEYIPGDLGAECKKYADEYIPMIIDYIENNYSPEEACKAIGACPQNKVSVQKFKDGNCESCKFFVNMILSYIEDNSTIQYVEQQLEGLCHYLPAPYGDQCTQLEKEYLPMVVHYLEEKYSAEDVCKLAGMCAANTASTGRINPLGRPHHGMSKQVKIAVRN